MNTKRDLWIWKETYEYGHRTNVYSKYVASCTCRQRYMRQRPTSSTFKGSQDPHHQHLRDPMCLGHLGKRPMNMKRDVLTWTETHEYEKRPMNMKRALWIWKETYECEQRPMNMNRNLWIWTETYEYKKRPMHMKRDLWIRKETYEYAKRPMNMTSFDFAYFCMIFKASRVFSALCMWVNCSGTHIHRSLFIFIGLCSLYDI